jgi:hypothetical protein
VTQEQNTNKPYPSWTWVTNESGESFWDAPKPLPTTHGKILKWDEEQVDWVEAD